MSRQHSYIATKADLLPGLQAFEARCPMKYVLHDWQQDPDFEIYHSGLDLPNLGLSIADSSTANPRYILIEACHDFEVRVIPQEDGTFYYEAQRAKSAPDLLFQPGGLFQDCCLIAGHIYTPMTTPAALSLYHRFVRALTKDFLSVQGEDRKLLVGPEAQKLACSGMRLITRFVGEASKYDLNEALLALTAFR